MSARTQRTDADPTLTELFPFGSPWLALLLLIVVVIVGGLVISAVSSIHRKFLEPNEMKARADVAAIAGAVSGYALENGRLPESLEVLVTPDARGLTYLARDTVPLDPWGNPYVLEPPSDGTERYRVISYGKDGKPGGTMDDADIDSLQVESGGNRGQE